MKKLNPFRFKYKGRYYSILEPSVSLIKRMKKYAVSMREFNRAKDKVILITF